MSKAKTKLILIYEGDSSWTYEIKKGDAEMNRSTVECLIVFKEELEQLIKHYKQGDVKED